MATFKATMLIQLGTNPDKTFSSVSRLGGWSESWFQTGTSPVNVDLKLRSLCLLRAPLLPLTASIVGTRVQQVDPVGASQSFVHAFPGSELATDVPQMALLCRAITAAGLNARQVRLAGIPDARVVNGEFLPSAAYTGALNNYFDEIIANWQIQAIDRSQPVQEIASVDAAGTVTFAAAHGLTAGMRLKFFRTRDVLGHPIKGIWLVQDPVTTLTLKVANWAGTAVGKGRARRYLVIYPAMANGTITAQRIITRKVGRAFFPYHGRVSNRR